MGHKDMSDFFSFLISFNYSYSRLFFLSLRALTHISRKNLNVYCIENVQNFMEQFS